MHWGSIEHFFAMGGHAAFVWGSYGATALALVLELWGLRRRQRQTLNPDTSPGRPR